MDTYIENVTSWQVLRTADISRKAILSHFLIIWSHIELGKAIFIQIKDFKTAC